MSHSNPFYYKVGLLGLIVLPMFILCLADEESDSSSVENQQKFMVTTENPFNGTNKFFVDALNMGFGCHCPKSQKVWVKERERHG